MTTFFLLAFWVYLFGAILLGWRAGKRDDHRAIMCICLAALASILANMIFALSTALALVFLIDLALLGFMVRFALRSKRYWPIWFAGFQAVICLLALAAVFVPIEVIRLDLLGGFWSMAALTVMAAGLLSDRRFNAT